MCVSVFVCVYVDAPVHWPAHVPAGGSQREGAGLLLGEGESWDLSCQVAGGICQLFAHCSPIEDLLQALK